MCIRRPTTGDRECFIPTFQRANGAKTGPFTMKHPRVAWHRYAENQHKHADFEKALRAEHAYFGDFKWWGEWDIDP